MGQQALANRNEIRRYIPNYTEISSGQGTASPQYLRFQEQFLQQLRAGSPPSGGVYGYFTAGGQCVYIGRTVDFAARRQGHGNRFGDAQFRMLFGTNHPQQQRGMEQRFMDKFAPTQNRRNAVGARNPNIQAIGESISGFHTNAQ
jgi:hypothetical protein